MGNFGIFHGMVIDATSLLEPTNRQIVPHVVGAGVRRDFGLHYVRMVTWILDRIYASRTGRAVIMSIELNRRGRDIRIVPYLTPSDCGAHSGRWSMGLQVTFSPEEFRPGNRCAGLPQRDATEVLLHELVHALRNLTGGHNSSEAIYWGGPEDLYATTITNIFSSEVGRRLRNGYDFPDPAFNPDSPDVDAFLRSYRNDFAFLNIHNGDLCKQLAVIDVPFNPIRRLLRPS
jgi:hypothetical protein